MVFDLKDCKKQYTIKVNSVTYQILVENLLDFAAHMAVKIKRDDVDQNGDNVKTQYNLSICNNTPCSVTFFHTTNNILVQLMKGDMKQIDDRIKNLSTFVERNFMILISDIESSSKYQFFKSQLKSALLQIQSNLQQGQQEGNKSICIENNVFCSSPRNARSENKQCHDCTPSKVKKRGTEPEKLQTLENEKRSLKQSLETLEAHQETLRSTIASKNELLNTQTKLVNDQQVKLDKQKVQLEELKINSETHKEFADSFLGCIVANEDQEGT